RIGLVKQDKPFRTALQYQSIMFMVSGRAVETVTKTPWSEVVSKRILEPLGMRNTWFTTTEAEKTADVASTHRRNELGELELNSLYLDENTKAESSMNSSAV